MANGIFNFGDRSIYDNTGAYDTMQPNQTMQPPQAGLLSPKGGQGAVTGIGERGKGILGSLFGAIGNAVRSPDFRDRLVLATGGLQMFPNEQAMAMARENIGRRRAEEQQMMQAKQTSEFFRQAGRPELASFVYNNPAAQEAAMSEYLTSLRPEPVNLTSLQKEYATYVDQMTIMNNQLVSEGQQPQPILGILQYQQAVKTGDTTNINLPSNQPEDASAWYESKRQADANTYTNQRELVDTLSRQNRDVQMMTTLMVSNEDSSQFENLFKDLFPLASEYLNIMSPAERGALGIRYALTPTFREAGSGSTSDFEMRLYLSILPRFTTSREGTLLASKIWQNKLDIESAVLAEYDRFAAIRNPTMQQEEEMRRNVRTLMAETVFTDEIMEEIQALDPNLVGVLQDNIAQGAENGYATSDLLMQFEPTEEEIAMLQDNPEAFRDEVLNPYLLRSSRNKIITIANQDTEMAEEIFARLGIEGPTELANVSDEDIQEVMDILRNYRF